VSGANPLVSDVFFLKRNHCLHNVTGPASDIAAGPQDKMKSFTNAFNREPTIANTLAAAKAQISQATPALRPRSFRS